MGTKRFRDYDDYHDELKKRTEETIGGNYINIFQPDAKLPFWKDAEGDHALDIIPYRSSENHPNYGPNKPVYKVEIWVHKRVGPEKGDYICLRNYGEDCPLCDARKEELESENPRKKITDALKGSQRCLYNVVVYTNNQEEKGVQVWEASSYLAESKFVEVAKNKRTGERIPFADPDKGKTVTFTIKGKNKNKTLTGIVFEDRPSVIPDDILDEAFTIEDYLKKPTFEELASVAKAVLAGIVSDDDDDQPETPPRRERGSSRSDDSEQQETRVGRERREQSEAQDVPGKHEEPEPETRRSRREETSEEPSEGRRSRREEPEQESEPEGRRSRRSEESSEPENSDGPPPSRRLRRRE